MDSESTWTGGPGMDVFSVRQSRCSQKELRVTTATTPATVPPWHACREADSPRLD